MNIETIKIIRWLECLAAQAYVPQSGWPKPDFVPSVVSLREPVTLSRWEQSEQRVMPFHEYKAGEVCSVETTVHGVVFFTPRSGMTKRQLHPHQFDVIEMRANIKKDADA